MLKKFLFLIRKFIFGVLFIYAFNVIVFPINTTISINIFTILIVSIFGLPGIIGICLFLFLFCKESNIMLDIYKYEQPILYNILNNSIINNKLSHAYLFDSNGNSDVYDIVLSFTKMIITSNIANETEKNNICMRIDDGNYVDVKVIEPDGMWIKKDQLLDLQSEFSKKSIEGSKKVYIIKSADKMNIQTANSILKFLEEPIDEIIAILVVDNINLMLPTIISRCQVIKLNKKPLSLDSIDNFSAYFFQSKYALLTETEKKELMESAVNFIHHIENNGIDTLIYTKKLWHNIFKDRDLCIVAVNLCIYFYYDVVKYKCGLNNYFYGDKLSEISFVSENNDYDELIKKIQILDRTENYLKRNLNINLLIDKMIIDMCGDDYEDS